MLPKISIITPSYNQGRYIEQTITSVLTQNYPNLEYIIIDGGSSDETIEIIKRYQHQLTYWVSEKDNGQGDAINKGLRKASGDIVAWLNSDDWYEKDALITVGNCWLKNQPFDVFQGEARFYFEDDEGKNFVTTYNEGATLERLLKYWSYDKDCNPPQPSVFIRRSLFEQLGLLDTHFHYAMDYDLWLKMVTTGHKFYYEPKLLSNYRFHNTSKSGTKLDFKHFHKEWHEVFEKNILKIPFWKRVKYYWSYTGFYYGYSKLLWPKRIFRLLLRGNIKESKFS
ncbi:glycosyltransferase family 2 protein [Flavitalea sp.]|nr:glycosyltransferase family 2 protein [Flavitalea sp.]